MMDLVQLVLLLAVSGLLIGMLYRQRTIVADKERIYAEQNILIETLRRDIVARDTRIADYQQEHAKLDGLILKLRQQIGQTDSNRGALEIRLKENESLVAHLRTQIESTTQESVQSKALFNTIATVAYDLVIVLDERGIVIALNHSADMLFGTKNPIGEPLIDLIDAPELHDLIVRAPEEPEGLEEQFTNANHYYRARTQVMHYATDHYFVGIAIQDITQLVKLNRARRDMVANISHELRTPIANIRMIIDGLFHDQSRPKRKASINSLRSIARETESLQWTVQDLLDLSMIESGQAIMKLVDEPLYQIVEDATTRIQEKLHRKHLTVVRHIPMKLTVLCDREHIIRVFINLISNAIKWSPANNVITISVVGTTDEVTISIFDNGPGVPDNQCERIFERFYQVDTARSGGEGSGLGLAICKHIVEAHGGRIWAEGNSQGAGGRFLFTLLTSGDEYIVPEMDRGQHDANLRPYMPLPQSNDQLNANNSIHSVADDFEIEFVDEDDGLLE